MNDTAIETLTLAFVDDPLYRWLFPDPTVREPALRATMQLTLELAGDRGVVDVAAQGEGVALWTEPGQQLMEDPRPFVELLDRWSPDRRHAALTGMAACQAHEPAEPHWVLHLLAVHPGSQGRGIARRLLAPTLHRCDAEGAPAYLETSNPPNVGFYRRMSFDLLAEVPVPGGGPTMLPLRRLPQRPR